MANQEPLVMSFPVETEIDGNPVGHPRFMLHCRIISGKRPEVEWSVSCSLPDRRRSFNRFERCFGQIAKDEAVSPELQEKLQEIETKRAELIKNLNANAQAIGIVEAPETWINKPSKRDFFDQLRQQEQLLPFPMTNAETARRHEADPSVDLTSIEMLEQNIDELISQRDQEIEACRSSKESVTLVLSQYLETARLHLAESDQLAILHELMLDPNRCTDLFQLEPLDKAREMLRGTGAMALSAERMFIRMDTILQALHPKNQGKAVISNYSYACFPPADELVATGDEQGYFDANVDNGIIGAKYDGHWILCIVERKTMLGLLDSWQKYQASNIPSVVLTALAPTD